MRARRRPAPRRWSRPASRRVVTAIADPDPRVNGKGHATLEAAGIAVTTGVLADEAARAHAGHISRVTKGRPHVTLKLAVSADGMIGRREGERMIITGKPAFDAVQAMRAESDAVMIGIGTALVDDPRLTVRLPAWRRARRSASSSTPTARLPLDSRLVAVGARRAADRSSSGRRRRPSARRRSREAGVRIDRGRRRAGRRRSRRGAATRSASEGFTRVLVEGGAEVAVVAGRRRPRSTRSCSSAPRSWSAPTACARSPACALSAIERSPRYRLIETAIGRRRPDAPLSAGAA